MALMPEINLPNSGVRPSVKYNIPIAAYNTVHRINIEEKCFRNQHSNQHSIHLLQTHEIMRFEELTPHLNKIATLYLRNNKRKVGWLFLERKIERSPGEMVGEVFFVNVQKGRRLIQFMQSDDQSALEPVRETISVREILRIRSSK